MAGNNSEKSFISLLQVMGILLALLLCLISSAMAAVVIPSSSPLLEQLLKDDQGDSFALITSDPPLQIPTPFQPIALPTLETVPPPSEPAPTIQPEETPTTLPETLAEPVYPSEPPPASALISGVKGRPQLYTLDCESQTAVDWARFFGTTIGHQEFIDRLPRSDDPEEGFVGDINGAMGQLPPNSYGVHAPPVAALLREYGVPALAVRNWDFEKIKHEIASGRPVIVWIVNLPYEIQTQSYTASNGNTTTVARFQHTWIITAYNASSVTVVDSIWTYNVRIPTFLERWQALENQAIIYISDY